MSKKLIISADDFVFLEAYTLGAIHGCVNGVVTVLSLMSNMDAAEFAVTMKNNVCLNIGMALHVNFVQGRSICDPGQIPSLVDSNGFFIEAISGKVMFLVLKNAKVMYTHFFDDIKREAKAQMEHFKELTGYYPIHMEGHSAMTTPMLQAFEELSEEYGIHYNEKIPFRGMGLYSYAEAKSPFLMKILERGSSPGDWEKDAFKVLNAPTKLQFCIFILII
ncbi:ChbG/HpnK family deacetylase [Alkalibaculum bacchi]|uniref:ChbG/HpnK family deacetylase n=1 Tax=Alkalibaculum bacchi TaxID=645887 RepID=UPI0026F2D019|nr:ChbG/HpnK family deacetylase [Alkalibaculum bacchi]